MKMKISHFWTHSFMALTMSLYSLTLYFLVKLIHEIHKNLCPTKIYDFAVCVFKVGGGPILQWPGSAHPCTIEVVLISVVYFVHRYILFLYNMQVSIVLMSYLFTPTISVYSVCSVTLRPYYVRQYCTLCMSCDFFTPTTNGNFHLTQFFLNICSVACAL